jgi:hypothetical protein
MNSFVVKVMNDQFLGRNFTNAGIRNGNEVVKYFESLLGIQLNDRLTQRVFEIKKELRFS